MDRSRGGGGENIRAVCLVWSSNDGNKREGVGIMKGVSHTTGWCCPGFQPIQSCLVYGSHVCGCSGGLERESVELLAAAAGRGGPRWLPLPNTTLLCSGQEGLQTITGLEQHALQCYSLLVVLMELCCVVLCLVLCHVLCGV